MVETFGYKPRPWVLAVGFTPEDDLGVALVNQVQTVTFISAGKTVDSQVRYTDYDALIAQGDIPDRPRYHLNVLQFGGSGEPGHRNEDGIQFRYTVDPSGRARLFSGPDSNVPPEAAGLARGSLGPWLVDTNPHDLLVKQNSNGRISKEEGIRALIREQDGRPCAGIWHREKSEEESAAEWWWLPADTPRKDQWLRAALLSWNRDYPQSFPSADELWADNPQWMTGQELSANKAVALTEDNLKAAMVEHEDRLKAAIAARQDARNAADDGVRRLLTHQGEDLKVAVASALAAVGYAVTDSDEKRLADGSPLLEDLQISDDDWIAIVEVKGYAKSGGKTADLLKIARAAVAFERATGHPPNARWYVINHNSSLTPDQRPEVLAGAVMDVQEFKQDDGLVVDTRDLFAVVQAVETGRMTPSEARAIFREQSGIFEM